MECEAITIWRTEYTYPGSILICKETVSADFPIRKYHGEGIDWHRTESAALIHAEEMRLTKIASLKNKIAKLEKMKFGDKQ